MTLGEWLCAFIAVSVVVRWLVLPLVELSVAYLLRVLVPITSATAAFNNCSINDTLLRSRSYFICAELLYRHGRTYFCASTLMDFRCFFDTGAMYALFRVADDYVDNDDERLRAAELNTDTGDIDPKRFAEGARERGAALESFITNFWSCWNSAIESQENNGSNCMTTAEMYDLHPVFPAVVESGLRCGFEPDLFDRFFNAMRMDAREFTPLNAEEVANAHRKSELLRKNDPKAQGEYVYIGNVCRNRAEIFKYMDGSAAVIGDFMLPLLIPLPARADFENDATYEAAKEKILVHRAKALPHARNLGNAFQLTNFIRDIHEDTQIARQYIPTDTCAKHGIYSMPTGETRQRLTAAKAAGTSVTGKIYMTKPMSYADNFDHGTDLYKHAGFVPLMEEMLGLAEELYADADIGIAMLPAQMSTVIAVARKAYSAMHNRIRGGEHKIYAKRFKVPISGKLAAAASILTKLQVAHIVVVEMVSALILQGVAVLRWFQTWGLKHFVVLFTMVAVLAVTAAAPSAVQNASDVSASVVLWPTLTSFVSLDVWIDSLDMLDGLKNCSYLTFHFIFTIPSAVMVWAAANFVISAETCPEARERLSFARTATTAWTAVLCCVATAYTLPWDDYLVANRVWWYGADRVYTDYLVGHTPLEEVFFFSIQTIILGGFFLLCVCCTDTSSMVPPSNLPRADTTNYLRIRRYGYLVLALSQGLGTVLLYTDGGGLLGAQGTYGGLILFWCTPVLAIQWCFGAEALINNRELVIFIVAAGTLFLVSIDRWAIRRSIWAISEAKSMPMWIADVFFGSDMPLEEALFFVVTSAMCTSGLALAVMASIEWRRQFKLCEQGPAGPSQVAMFFSALCAVYDWGCSGAKGRESIPTKSLARWKAGKADTVQKPPQLINVLYLVALFGVPLAAVAHKPVGVARAMFGAVSYALTAFSGASTSVATSKATSVVLAAMPILRAARLLQAAVSLVVVVFCLRSIATETSWRQLLLLAAGNLLFANLELPVACGTCAALFLAMAPRSQAKAPQLASSSSPSTLYA